MRGFQWVVFLFLIESSFISVWAQDAIDSVE